MANKSGLKDDTSIEFNRESTDSSFEIKVRTRGPRSLPFRVNKNMTISALKGEIVTKFGIPVERQRLIFKGGFLKDDKLLSEYNLEDGNTVILVESKPETSSSQGARIESSQNTTNIHSDNPPTNIPRISSNRAQTSPPFAHTPTQQNENEPTLVPNALTTISEYMDQMERSLGGNNILWNDDRTQMDLMQPRADDHLYARDAPTPAYLSLVFDRTEELLRNNVPTAILNLTTRLQRIDSSSNPILRSQIQEGSRGLGIALHKLGAMFLELGRITMCLNMGETSEESLVHSGPAVYISRTGPNPEMIELHPMLSTLFWDFHPTRPEEGQFMPTNPDSQVFGSTASRGEQHHESGSPRGRPSGSESGSVERQIDLAEVVQRIEQHGDPINIFGALLEISVRVHGEQNAYQDMVELGNNEELANEFMEVLRRDIRLRLTNESSSMEE